MPNIQTPYDIGQTIKSRRKQLGWDQAQLADKIGVSRQWIINIEQGKPRAEIGLILRALHALELPVFIGQINTDSTSKNMPNIDKVLEDTKNEQAKHAIAVKLTTENPDPFKYPKGVPNIQKVMEPAINIRNALDVQKDIQKKVDFSEALKKILDIQKTLVPSESLIKMLATQKNLVPSEALKKIPPAQQGKGKTKK